MKHNWLARKIVQIAGGINNIHTLTFCATRLRLEFNQCTIVDITAIQNLPSIISVVEKGGQFQIVIGNEVPSVYRSINEALSGHGSHKATDEKQEKQSVISQIISVVSTTFTPVISAITGMGGLAPIFPYTFYHLTHI